MQILNFYILRAFFKPFCMGIIFFTSLIIIMQIFTKTGVLIERQLPPLVIAEYFVCQIPFTLLLVTPVAVLLACLFSLGTLSHHNEIIAMKSSGVNLYRIILPILSASLLISILSILLSEFVVPNANQRWLLIKSQKIYKKNISYKVSNLSFRSEQGWFLTINLFDKEKGIMEGIVIKGRHPDGHPSLRIDAKKARWIGEIWLLEKGIMRKFNQQGLIIKEEQFKTKKIKMWSPEEIWIISQVEKKESNEMSIKDLIAYIRLLQASGSKFNDKLVDLHLKISFPFANLVIALIGSSLALQRARGGRATSFGLSIIISFLYWETIGIGRALGMAEKLPTALSAWIANIIFLIIGIYLAVKAKK